MKKDVSSDDEEANILGEFSVLYDDVNINLTTHKTNQVINNDASFYATSRRGFFSSYIPRNYRSIKMENDNLTRVASE